MDILVKKCVRLHFSRSPLNTIIPNFFFGEAAISINESCWNLGDLVDNFKFHLHVLEIYSKACGVSQCIFRGTVYRSAEIIVKVFIMHIQPIKILSYMFERKYLSGCNF